jgi:type II restriction/modification system DNA methylase subunit YeeA
MINASNYPVIKSDSVKAKFGVSKQIYLVSNSVILSITYLKALCVHIRMESVVHAKCFKKQLL